MPPVWSWMAKPSSKLLDEKSPEGTVTDPSTVTTVPSGSWRAAPMSIGCGSWAAASAGIAASARPRTARPAARRGRLGVSREARDMGRSSRVRTVDARRPEPGHRRAGIRIASRAAGSSGRIKENAKGMVYEVSSLRLQWAEQPVGPLAGEAESAVQAAAAGQGDRDRAARRRALDPALVDEPSEQRRAQRAGDVRYLLAPIEAGGGEGAAARPRRRQVDAELAQQAHPCGRHCELIAHQAHRAAIEQGAGKANAQPARQVVVASAPGAHRAADARLPVRARRRLRRQHGQRLHRL